MKYNKYDHIDVEILSMPEGEEHGRGHYTLSVVCYEEEAPVIGMPRGAFCYYS